MDTLDTGTKRTALIILVGPPGSGKSTWGENFAKKNGIKKISTDEIRAEIGSGEHDQSVSAQAFSLARQRVKDELKAGRSVIIDATSVNRKARRDWINLARGAGAFVIAVPFEVSREELIRRDANRPRTVGPEIIDRFLNKYERPSVGEVDRVIIP